MSIRPTLDSTSPALAASRGGKAPGEFPATELKFLVSLSQAERIEEWARKRLSGDPHADADTGGYRVTTVYLDTPALDIFRRNPGFGTSKYRLRRYGLSSMAHAEHKAKENGRVWKMRESVGAPVAQWPGSGYPTGLPGWFAQAVATAHLRPVCAISYARVALLGDSASGPVRMTIDREARARCATDCSLQPVTTDGSIGLLSHEVIVELKHLGSLPSLFKEMMSIFMLVSNGASKYRRAVTSLGLDATAVSSQRISYQY